MDDIDRENEGDFLAAAEMVTPENYDKYLDLEAQNLKSVLVLPVGYRSKDDMFSSMKKVRRPLEEVIIDID